MKLYDVEKGMIALIEEAILTCEPRHSARWEFRTSVSNEIHSLDFGPVLIEYCRGEYEIISIKGFLGLHFCGRTYHFYEDLAVGKVVTDYVMKAQQQKLDDRDAKKARKAEEFAKALRAAMATLDPKAGKKTWK